MKSTSTFRPRREGGRTRSAELGGRGWLLLLALRLVQCLAALSRRRVMVWGATVFRGVLRSVRALPQAVARGSCPGGRLAPTSLRCSRCGVRRQTPSARLRLAVVKQ
jgi:hypothetical protein